MDEYASVIAIEAQESQSGSDSEFEEEKTEGQIKTSHDVHKEMSAIKSAVLASIAQNLEDPMSALLALELGAAFRIAASCQLENWYKIASVLDKDTITRRVDPQRKKLENSNRVPANAKTIVAGEAAPDFTLANLEGEDVALYKDVLANNEVVLIDF